jgi:hypothetical protein
MKQSKLSPEKELESLKAEINKIDDHRSVLQKRVRVLEDQVWEPSLKKKYVGTYYKFNNSVTFKSKTFWVYYQVTDVDGVDIIVNEFKESPFGGYHFEIHNSVPVSQLEKKITKREWDRELNKFLGNVKKLK